MAEFEFFIFWEGGICLSEEANRSKTRGNAREMKNIQKSIVKLGEVLIEAS